MCKKYSSVRGVGGWASRGGKSFFRSQCVCPVTAVHLSSTCDTWSGVAGAWFRAQAGGRATRGPGWEGVALRAKHQVTHQVQFIETRRRHLLSPVRLAFLLLSLPLHCWAAGTASADRRIKAFFIITFCAGSCAPCTAPSVIPH